MRGRTKQCLSLPHLIVSHAPNRVMLTLNEVKGKHLSLPRVSPATAVLPGRLAASSWSLRPPQGR